MRYAIILLMALSNYSQAWEIDLGLGYTWTEKPRNGLWYQEEFEHSIDSNSVNYQLGLRFKPWDNIYITTGYKHLGDFSVEADFIGNDKVYANYLAGEESGPISHLSGEGEAYGVYLKGEYHFTRYPVFVTAGGWVHKSEWDVESPAEMRMHPDGPRKGEIHGPYNIPHHNNAKPVLGYIYGIGIKQGDFSLSLEIWQTNNDGDYPSTFKGDSKVLTLVWTH